MTPADGQLILLALTVSFVLPLATLGAYSVVANIITWWSRRFLTPEMRSLKSIPGGIGGRFDWGHLLALVTRPRVHACCWAIAPDDTSIRGRLLRISKGRAEKFGLFLPALTEKVLRVPEEGRTTKWEQVMQYADRSPEEHAILAAPGYSLKVAMVAVDYGLPLEYAEAMCSASDHLSLVAA